MITLYKPDGKKMEVNEESLSFALSLGWAKGDPAKAEAEAKAEAKAKAKAEK